MFHLSRLRFSQVNLNVSSHVASRSLPIADQLRQVGIKPADVEACSNKGGAGICARAASSLLQDWVMLAHRRPIHSSNSDPTTNVSTRSWSDEECALISKTVQLRDFDQSKLIKMSVFNQSQNQQSKTQQTVSRSDESVVDDQPVPSSLFSSSASSVESSPVASSSTSKLKPRIVVRQRRSSASSESEQLKSETKVAATSASSSFEQSNAAVQQQQTAQQSVQQQSEETAATSATPRRRVVRVGGASR